MTKQLTDQEYELFLGVVRKDITPTQPVRLAGFGDRTEPFRSVLRPIYAHIWAFKQSNPDSDFTVMIQGDLLWWGETLIKQVKERVRKVVQHQGIDFIFHATHSHAGPQTSDRFLELLGELDARYLAYLEDVVVEGILEALKVLEPVRMERGRGKGTLGIYRRKMVDGKMTMAPNPDVPIDDEVQVIRFVKPDGQTHGLWVHYTCHPTVTGINELSSEYPGIMREYLEVKYGLEGKISFLQGCTADIRPALHDDNAFYKGTFEHVQELGLRLGKEVERILEDEKLEPLSNALMKVKTDLVKLPLRPVSLEEARPNFANEETFLEWKTKISEQPREQREFLELELQRISLSEDLALVTMNGEMVQHYGNVIKSFSGGKDLPLAYSNGMIGYVPTAKQLEEGGYEAYNSNYYFAMAGPFTAEAQGIIEDAIKRLYVD